MSFADGFWFWIGKQIAEVAMFVGVVVLIPPLIFAGLVVIVAYHRVRKWLKP